MGMLQEFRDFALKSNFLDMATGIVIGAAVGTVVKSLVEDVIMPPIGMLMGGVDFSDIKIPLSDGPDAAAINIGTFFNNLISFVIVLGAIFMIIKAFNAAKAKMMEEEKAAPAEPSEEILLLREIR
ncbi:MAG: large conductance mechanosensitive channel protein MscL, partial [Pseudomonadota bacterium]